MHINGLRWLMDEWCSCGHTGYRSRSGFTFSACALTVTLIVTNSTFPSYATNLCTYRYAPVGPILLNDIEHAYTSDGHCLIDPTTGWNQLTHSSPAAYKSMVILEMPNQYQCQLKHIRSGDQCFYASAAVAFPKLWMSWRSTKELAGVFFWCPNFFRVKGVKNKVLLPQGQTETHPPLFSIKAIGSRSRGSGLKF